MSDIEEFVDNIGEKDLQVLSRLLAQLSSFGLTNSEHWLLRLLTRIELETLFHWVVRFGRVLTELTLNIPKDVDEFVELLKLRQLSNGVESGLMDINKLNYIQFFYQYLSRYNTYILEIDNIEKFQGLLRIDEDLEEICIFNTAVSSSRVIISSENVTLNDILLLHLDKRLPVTSLIHLSINPSLEIDEDLVKIPLKLYTLNPISFSHKLVTNRFYVQK